MERHPLGSSRDVIFFASGLAGVAYESIWTQYLKLFLGHAAYAQTLVLAIFMGGMAVGAAAAARYSARITSPLTFYAIIEGAIGALAFAFHPLFTSTTGGVYELASAGHLAGESFAAVKWGLAALLILPQSVLLGATFPLFAAAAIRAAPAAAGRSLALLYFANSLGGAVGVLTAGFFLVPALDLPGTIAAIGTVNLAIAGWVGWRTKNVAGDRTASANVAERSMALRAAIASVDSDSAHQRPSFGAAEQLLLSASLLTGASSFIYEVGWIRMLSLVLGSATHSFELMLSSFVLGLACGGWWIRTRADAAPNPGILLGHIQIAMACAALATLPLYGWSFDIIAQVVTRAPKTDIGYTLFNLARFGITALVMFPAAFCAGMTLPLVTRILVAPERNGEQAIGLVYSVNTIGAIIGLAFAVHIGLPKLGLRFLVASGAAIDALLGVALLLAYGGHMKIRHALLALSACALGAGAVARTFDPQRLASGVFRTGQATTRSKVIAMADGKTATITIEASGDYVTIKTNGKPDAAADVRSPTNFTSDQLTMTLTGAIPLLLHDMPRRVANIGLGSGITGETILADPRVLHLDTIEIEPKVVELARRFYPLNRSVYYDPRSAIHIDDAKSFFAANGEKYDLIVSEPSNPWVSGVAGLFSVEFYRHVARYLHPGGLFAQWLQVYETHPDRVASVLKAMDRVFADYLVVALGDSDLLLVGRVDGKVTLPENAYARTSERTQELLRRVEVATQSDITIRIIGNKAMLKPWLDASPVPANSDFAPYLDVNADRDRFLHKFWPDLHGVARSALPIAEILGARPMLATPSAISSVSYLGGRDPPWPVARWVQETLAAPLAPTDHSLTRNRPSKEAAREGIALLANCAAPPQKDAPPAASELAMRVLPFVSPTEGRAVLAALADSACLADRNPRQWPLLLASVADRNPATFGAIAEDMLQDGRGVSPTVGAYLLGMAMLGNIDTGDTAHARAIWNQYSAQMLGPGPHELAFDILRAHAFAGYRRARPGQR